MNTVLTYWAEIEPLLNPENYQKIYDTLPLWRREKADRIRFSRDRALSVGAWRLYTLALEQAEAAEEAPFNLSHSGDYVLVSIAPEKEQVGCDIEVMKDAKDSLAKRFFRQQEYEWMMAQEEKDRKEAFYRLWVLKESFMRATRYGMKLGLDSFELEIPEEGEPALCVQPDFVKGRYFFREYTVPRKDARIAVCSTSSMFVQPKKIELI